ncbi:MAG: mechanosensitive ion channel domain-containing protein [Cyanobacteria bacterium P01_F01_bin.150]
MDDSSKKWTDRPSVKANHKLAKHFSTELSSVGRLARRFFLRGSIGGIVALLLISTGLLPDVSSVATRYATRFATGDWSVPVAIAPSNAQENPNPEALSAPAPTAPESNPSDNDQDVQPLTIDPTSSPQPSRPPKLGQGQTAVEAPESSSDAIENDSYVPKEAITVKRTMAPVVLDGQILFEVASYGNLSAEERANQISETLEVWANQKELPDIAIEEGRGTTSIVLTNPEGIKVNLITVTKSDAIHALLTPQVQAREWVIKIRETLRKAQAERNPEVLGRSIVLATASFMLTCLIFLYLKRWQFRVSKHPLKQLQRLIQGKVKRDGIPIHVRQVALALCLEFFRYGIWIAVIFYITQLFPATRQGSYDLTTQLLANLNAEIFPLGGEKYSIIDLLILIAGFLILVVGSTLITNVLKTRILQLAGIGVGAQQAIATLSRYTLIGVGTVVILQLWGLDLSSLTIIASALGVGIGFGLQNIARDFSSGLVLLFERPVQVGDFIEVGKFRGTVDRIGARSTMIKTLDQVSVIVPNSYFLDNQVVNWSHDNPLSRISIPVGVAYQADPEQVKSLLLQAGTTHQGVLQIPAPQVLFKGFGDNSLNFELLVWIVEPNRQPLIRSDLNFSVLRLLQEHGIEIPYPQRDLHIRTGQLSYVPTDSAIADSSMADSPFFEQPQPKQPKNMPKISDNDSAI